MDDYIKIIALFAVLFIGFKAYHGTLENPFAAKKPGSSLGAPSGMKGSVARVRSSQKTVKMAEARVAKLKKLTANPAKVKHADIKALKAAEQDLIDAQKMLAQAKIDLAERDMKKKK